MNNFEPLPFLGERFPFYGGDLQTLHDWFFPTIRGEDTADAFQIKLADGDCLTGKIAAPTRPAIGSLILVHGLGGSSQSQHLRALEAAALSSGYVCMRINMRGAGTSRPHCKQTYHAQRGADLLPFISKMRALHPDLPCVMVAHSLGGSVALNMALDYPEEASWLAGMTTISAPLDLVASNAQFHRTRNRLYMRYILASLKSIASTCPDLPQSYRNAAASAQSVEAFDLTVTAPMNGFASLRAYYEAASTCHRLEAMQLPLLLLHAKNDPWISGEAYRVATLSSSTALALVDGGGHIGFHEKGKTRLSWHIRTTLAFCNYLRKTA